MPFQEHVEGENCDRCKPGFFNLQQNNPEGCEECFCSGKTNICTNSHFTYRSVRKIIPYQYMSLLLCFCVLSLTIVAMFLLIRRSCMFLMPHVSPCSLWVPSNWSCSTILWYFSSTQKKMLTSFVSLLCEKVLK